MKPATLSNDDSTKRRRAAFTLLEMLVATALCGVLLMGLWTLYSTYANLFERGQARVERSQLCRALMQQIADDLQSAIQDPIAGLPERSSGAAQRRRFGLAGTSSELRMDVLQITPRQGNPMPVGDAAGQTASQTAVQTEARVPELRTVYYTFSPPGAALDAEFTAAPAGLIRRELDFETPAGASDAFPAAADAEPSVGVDTDLAAQNQPSDSGAATAAPTAVDDRWTWVPEVVSLEFRYFDGSSWSGSWNSLLRGSLPVAVEVRIALGDPQAPSPLETATGDADANLDADGNLDADLDADAVHPPAVSSAVTNVQMIVDLPSSAEYRKPRVADSTAQRLPARSTVRRIVPRRWTSPGASQQRPEDWLRTGK
jgi:prepilin-type N-terminal cleavage/methylation domain-containing protein